MPTFGRCGDRTWRNSRRCSSKPKSNPKPKSNQGDLMRMLFALFAIPALVCAQGTPQPPATGATQPGRGGRGPQAPAFISPEVQADRHVVFRIYAPQAQAVRVSGGDIPGNGQGGTAAAKGENGVWEATLGPIDPGAYRYNFKVD